MADLSKLPDSKLKDLFGDALIDKGRALDHYHSELVDGDDPHGAEQRFENADDFFQQVKAEMRKRFIKANPGRPVPRQFE